MYETKPWLKFYGDVPQSLTYPDVTLYQALMRTVEKFPDAIAYDFFGTTATYRQMADDIDRAARALAAQGIKPGDRVTISMPTCPQGVVCVYAAIKLGAVASMIHPLSTPKEIEFYLNVAESHVALTLDAFYQPFKEIWDNSRLETLILARISEHMPLPLKIGFWLTKGRKIPKVPPDPRIRWWSQLMGAKLPEVDTAAADPDDLAVIMYSGGTTGFPKGIMLSHKNFISQGMMAAAWGGITAGDSMLAILPIFHGFGLGVCINTMFMGGGKSVLVPQFSAEVMAKLIKSKRPTHLVGVPTLYEALTSNPDFQRANLSSLKAAFVGADHMPRKVKDEFEAMCKRSGADINMLEGYGLTEAVTGIMAMPLGEYREKSMGVPFPDMLAKVIKIGTTDEVPVGEEGEICLHGPAVMLGYLNQPEETAETLREHPDGKTWLHTGDIASMDEDGFFYFKTRLKRMIKSSGMNVYPAQVEDILAKHPDVDTACVIGVPDEKQVERVKGFVVLKDPAKASPETEKALLAHCREHLIKWSCPREIEFRTELPLTRIGKIAFKDLEAEEIDKLKAAGKYTGES